MENSYQESEMNQKIQIKITWVENEDGISEPEIVLDAELCSETIVNSQMPFFNSSMICFFDIVFIIFP